MNVVRPTWSDVLQCCIAYNEYGGYCVPLASQHRPTARAIRSGEVHEAHTIDFICESCGTGDIVHAGAYFGDFLPALARACSPGALVWAFEPNTENYRCADITSSINGLDNVQLFNAALGAEPSDEAMLTIDDRGRALGGGSCIVVPDASLYGRTQTVRVLAVDEVVPLDRQVSVVHLDVERYETSALAGALRTIARCLPTIIVENLPDDEWRATHLDPLGYRVSTTLKRNVVLQVGVA